MAIMVSACTDILEEVPKDFISAGNFYQNTQQVEDGLTGAYRGMWGDIDGNAYLNMGELHNDWSVASGSYASVANFDLPLGSRTYSRLRSSWRGFYRIIMRANTIMTKAPLVEDMDENTRTRIIAEAHFLRAWSYFNLLRRWGPLPLITEEFSGASELAVPRAPIEQVQQLIIDDLLIAEKGCLADVGNNTGRASKWAAKAVLQQVYLDKEDWSAAAAKADELITSSQFSLISVNKQEDFYKIFATVSTSSEEIMAIHFSDNLKPTFMQWYHGVGSPYNTGATWGFTNRPNMESPFILNWEKNDLRYDFNLYSNFVNDVGDTVYLEGVASTRYKKWIKNPDGDALYNHPILRFAEAYLIYAEASCMATGNPSSLALERLNIIKRRGYGYDPYSPSPIDFPSGMSKDEFRAAVIQERGYEFFMEYSRWWDLKRTGTAKALISAASGKAFTDTRLLFPIPEGEMGANPAISENNPGY